MKRRLYQKLILAWICFAVLSFVSVAGITSSLVEKNGNSTIEELQSV